LQMNTVWWTEYISHIHCATAVWGSFTAFWEPVSLSSADKKRHMILVPSAGRNLSFCGQGQSYK
jgi:hypothetical protein